MIWLRALAMGVLLAGAIGYPVAVAMLLHLRRWLGDAGRGWPRLVLDALVALMLGTGALYYLSLGTQLGLLAGWPRMALNVGAAVFLALVPWALVRVLWLWRRDVERQRRPPWQREPPERGIDD